MSDLINHPPHYKQHPSGIECIQITEHMNFNLGNATKYIWRADEKHSDGGMADLKKAAWYLDREICKRLKAGSALKAQHENIKHSLKNCPKCDHKIGLPHIPNNI